MEFSTGDLRDLLAAFARRIVVERDALCAFDGVIGDAAPRASANDRSAPGPGSRLRGHAYRRNLPRDESGRRRKNIAG